MRLPRYYLFFALLTFWGTTLLLQSVPKSAATRVTRPPIAKTTASGMFVQNVGQFRKGALFQSRTDVGTLFITEDALWLTIMEPRAAPPNSITRDATEPEMLPRRGVHLRLSFVDANPHPVIEPYAPLTTSVNYFHGDDPAKWYTDVPVWGGVRYRDLYEGIDLEVREVAGYLAPRLVIHARGYASLSQVQLQVEGASISGLADGFFTIDTEFGTQHLPLLTVVEAHRASLTVPAPQSREQTIITPFAVTSLIERPALTSSLPSNLIYASYLGGNDTDLGRAVDVDASGAMYVAGSTESFDFPTTPGAFDPIPYPSDYAIEVFVTKFSPDGRSLDYSTFISGNDSDYAYDIEVDGNGAAFVSGTTWSDDFPTTLNAPGGFGGEVDAFILKLNPAGSALAYSIVLGGNLVDTGYGVAVGSDGTAVLAGKAGSQNFPVTPNAYDTTRNDEDFFDAFVTKINPSGTAFIYSTLLGGSNSEQVFGVYMNAFGDVYLMGQTVNDFPTTPNAYDTTCGFWAYFVTKFTANGEELEYSTCVGQWGGIFEAALAVDVQGAAYVVGQTDALGFPTTPGVYDPIFHNPKGSEGVYFKLDPTGSTLEFSTFFGESNSTNAYHIVLDGDRNAYISAHRGTPGIPLTPGAYASIGDFGILKFNADASQLLHVASVPGATSATGYRIVLLEPDVIIGAGLTGSDVYPVTEDAYDPTWNGDTDATIFKLALPLTATEQVILTSSEEVSSTVDGTSYAFAPNTFTDTVVFTHAPRHPLSLSPVAPLVSVGHTFANIAVISSTETSVSPTQPYTLTIEYADSEIQGLEEATLTLYGWDGVAWQPEPSALLDTDLNRIVAHPARFGWWTVVSAPRRFFLPLVSRS